MFDDVIKVTRLNENFTGDSTIGKLYWHIHHETLVELADVAIENRISYIIENKPYNERATRLLLLKAVRNVPEELAKAIEDIATYDEKHDAYHARIDSQKAPIPNEDRIAREGEAICGSRPNISAVLNKLTRDGVFDELHKLECDPNCPWDGHTIFPLRGF